MEHPYGTAWRLDRPPVRARTELDRSATLRGRLGAEAPGYGGWWRFRRSAPAQGGDLARRAKCPDTHVRDLHQVGRRRGVADLSMPRGRMHRCDAVGQDDEIRANWYVSRISADVQAIKEDLN